MIRRTIENILRPFNFWRTLPTESGNGKIWVSSNVGGLRFALKSPRSWDSELVNVARMLVQPGGIRETIDIPCFHPSKLLDIFEAPQVVKIDVEGVELQVLQAAEKLLSDVRSIFYVEIMSGVRDQIASIFLDHKYCLFEPVDDSSCLSRGTQQCGFNNIVIPHEKRNYFGKLIT